MRGYRDFATLVYGIHGNGRNEAAAYREYFGVAGGSTMSSGVGASDGPSLICRAEYEPSS